MGKEDIKKFQFKKGNDLAKGHGRPKGKSMRSILKDVLNMSYELPGKTQSKRLLAMKRFISEKYPGQTLNIKELLIISDAVSGILDGNQGAINRLFEYTLGKPLSGSLNVNLDGEDITHDLSKLSDKELDTLERLTAKAENNNVLE